MFSHRINVWRSRRINHRRNVWRSRRINIHFATVATCGCTGVSIYQCLFCHRIDAWRYNDAVIQFSIVSTRGHTLGMVFLLSTVATRGRARVSVLNLPPYRRGDVQWRSYPIFYRINAWTYNDDVCSIFHHTNAWTCTSASV